MKSIKFRAWDKEEECFGDTKGLVMNLNGELVTEGEWAGEIVTFPTHPYIFEQFTGLKDTNGVEIYEGDIVKDVITGLIFSITWNDDRARYEYTGHYSKNQHSWNLDCDRAMEFEVIGNTHENTELFEKGQCAL
jgi:uncharacterized phage protein (TIGR01671 family)